ncbi:MAG TPA: multidrug efflux RND transporter permease subunit [Gemmatimonadales bacterium]|nr:multidrug efflux RND transporter permease subunit [Gemmatimonadales bacterium]HRZ08286.1 multidrug efflux RND transporter permease subunit [Gemmatimonadales bacterium]
MSEHPPAPGGTAGGGAPYVARNLFIRRPIFASVISIVILLMGIASIMALPITLYPRITPPSVQVTAVYPGATAEDVAEAVAAPIEQQLSSMDGLLYFKSSNGSDGTMNLSIYFDISRDQDLAAVDVQNQVKLAEPQLPEEVRRQGITVKKSQPDILLMIALTSDDPRYDAEYLSNYSKINLEDEVKRIKGVGDAYTFGQLEFSMLLQLDPDRMAQLGLTVADVQNAVREQNTTNPGGRVGREPSPPGTDLTLPVTTKGRLKTEAEFGNIILRTGRDGAVLRMSDVANVTLGARNYDLIGRLNGEPNALLLVYLRAGANALEVKDKILTRLDELAANFPPGVAYTVSYDTTPFITASIEEVIHTLGEAMLLVTLVVFIFLQSWRTTLIPLLAVPVSIVGTFAGMALLGFSINILTLFGLVLAIGIVVDDAIIVIENVERIMATEHVGVVEATDKAMTQVSGALIAIVLVLAAVFIPVGFMGGITGAMFMQFAVTIVVSVILSGIVALTLTPALCTLLIKDEHPTKGRFFTAFNNAFDRFTATYVGGVRGVLGRPKSFLAAFAVILALIVMLFKTTPGGFVPTEDKGYFALGVNLPAGASRQRSDSVVAKIERIVASKPGVRNVISLVGFDFIMNANLTHATTMFVMLEPWEERTDEATSIGGIIDAVNRDLSQLPEATAFAFNLPEISGMGTTAGLEMNLLDRSGGSVKEFAGVVGEYVAAARQSPDVSRPRALISVNTPQVYVTVDREKVKSLGVSLTDVFQTLQTMLSAVYINDFNLFGRTYRVQAEAQPQFRVTPADIGKLYVPAPGGAMVPISALSTTEFIGGPSVVSRFNGFTSALVTAEPGAGKSSGQMMAAVESAAQSFADRGVAYAYSGQSYQEKLAQGQGNTVFILGIVLVFLVLAAQYESWSIPFGVILGVPFGVVGALIGILLRGVPNDLYFQIGLVTVIGLAAKNAILIVEFANSLRVAGATVREAALEAAKDRFRPILMTSFAFILGVVPMLIASGAGAQSRHSLATGVFAGMLIATAIGVLFIPLFFYLIAGAGEKKSAKGAEA